MKNSTPATYSYSWLIQQFNRAKNHAEKLVSEINKTYLFRKPATDIWSIAECLTHLNKFGNIYYKKINQEIERADTDVKNSSQSFSPRLMWRGIIWLFEPPYKLKLKTISIFEPSQKNSLDNKDNFKAFTVLQNQFIKQLERCQRKGVNLDSKKISNPALPFLKMRLSESYGIILAHQHRHFWQAEQILSKMRS